MQRCAQTPPRINWSSEATMYGTPPIQGLWHIGFEGSADTSISIEDWQGR